MKNGKPGIGVMGLGNRGVFFGCRAFVEGNGELVAVCDLDPSKIETAKEYFPSTVRTYTDIDDFLADPDLDAVCVTTPDFAHADCAVAVLRAKKHLYLEKPMAQTIEDCDRIINAWYGSDTVFMVGLELRYCTLMRDVKKLIDAGEIGRVITGTVIDNVSVGGQYYYHGSRRKKQYIKSLILEKGTHSIDLDNWIVDQSPVKVYSSGGLDVFGGNAPNDKRCADCEERATCPYAVKPSFRTPEEQKFLRVQDGCVYAKECDVPDNGLVLIDYDGGARICYMECHFTPEYTREFMFVGDRGKLTAFFDNEQNFKIMVWKRHEPAPVYYYPEKIDSNSHGGGDTGIVEAFFRRVREGKPCMVGVQGARDAAAIAIAATKSEETGMPEFIPAITYPPESIR
ncbi:MAG: Gfo/Idh/MocA family oxidoreductase [Clostridiaceae bacterium]|nr:Gfo/Idh/MocA family oxidoreductase [Clostridiaceae bacterium]